VTTGEDGKEKGIQMRPSFYWRINQRGNWEDDECEEWSQDLKRKCKRH
jgi:hypothetical protein